MTRSPSHRRYLGRLAAAMSGYVATLLLAEILIDNQGATGALAYGAALLPGLCIAGVFWALARLLVEEEDEYLRMLLVRQLLFASGMTLTIATIWGFLENFRLVPHIDTFYIAILFFIAQGLGALVNKLTVGDSGGGC